MTYLHLPVRFFSSHILLFLGIAFSFSLREDLLTFFCQAGGVAMNSFSFCLSGKLFLSSSILYDNLAG